MTNGFDVTDYGNDSIAFSAEMNWPAFQYVAYQKALELHPPLAMSIGDYPIKVRVVITIEDQEEARNVAADYERYEK